jgi:hypothetical protein
MSIMSDGPTPSSLLDVVYISYLGNPLGGVGPSDMIDIALMYLKKFLVDSWPFSPFEYGLMQ